MPPKRKNAQTVVDSASDTVKKSKKQPKEEMKKRNDAHHEEEEPSLPSKRSRPTRAGKAVVSYDEGHESDTPIKSKKESKSKKSTKKEKEPTKRKLTKAGPSQVESQDEILPPVEESIKDKKQKNKVKKEKLKKTNPKKDDLISEEKPESEDDEPVPEKVLQNKTQTEWDTIDFSCSKTNGFNIKYNLIISTWNVGGIKSWVKKGCLEYLNHEKPDVLCLQETKCDEEKLPEEIKEIKHYHQYWCSSKKEGYAGVGLLSIIKPKNVTYGINNEEQDIDGRCITAEYEQFFLINVYVPNSGRKLVTLPKRLEWNKAFKDYVKTLDEKKPVIICGDLNVSHNEIDLARPKSNTKNAGFTHEEREGMTEFLKEGFVDIYRNFYPSEEGVYSFWTYMANARAKNVGWRLDYFICSQGVLKGVCDVTYRTQVLGSDHCPVTLFINI